MGGGKEELNESREGSEEGGLSQGEDEVDETDDDADIEVMTPSTSCMTATQRGTQVAELDQQEYPLMGGKWVGKGAMQKAAEI